MHTEFSLENLQGRDHLDDLDVGGRILLECILNGRNAWIGCIWLRIGSSGGLLNGS
jgi:hypothetical protein